MNPPIVWTTAAENRLDEYCSRHQPPLSASATRDGIATDLRRAFPHEATVIVLNLFVGFRVRANESILLIDTGSGTVIVKLADAHRLRQEYDALHSTTNRGFDGNQVFLRLRAVPDATAPAALVYQTAQSRIGLPDTRALQEVFLHSVRHGSPTPESVGDAIRDLFASLGNECYGVANERQPVETLWPLVRYEDIGLNPSVADGQRHRLGDSLVAWGSGDPATIRRAALSAFPIRRGQPLLIDPVDFFAGTLAELRATIRDDSAAGQERLAATLPRVLIGRAHGDLHGQNVIVGVEENAACLPSLFDYENMSAGNLLAWDFAKLETELKIRAHAANRPTGSPDSAVSPRRFAWDIGRFENELAERTERHRWDGHWPTTAGPNPSERLLVLLLRIREAAARWLGRDRPGRWLHEYYFILAAYGVFSVRYENQTERERMGAFVSAGVAAARYAWGVTLVVGGTPASGGTPPPRDTLRQVWQFNRSGGSLKALPLAEGLTETLPHDIHAWYELAFAQVKVKDRAAALKTLERANDQFAGRLDEDTFSLWGRCYKDAGDDARLAAESASGDPHASLLQADESYRRACEYYERGYNLDGNQFPGINLATLLLVRAALAKSLGRPDANALHDNAKRVAGELADTADRWLAKLEDDAIWLPATRGEAELLRERWTTAADYYRQAFAQPGFQAGYLDGMRAQVERVLAAMRALSIHPQGPLANPGTFFQLTSLETTT